MLDAKLVCALLVLPLAAAPLLLTGDEAAPESALESTPAPRSESVAARSSTAAATAGPRQDANPVSVAGVLVHRPLAREGDMGEELAFFGTFSTVRVALELDLARVEAAAGRQVVAFDSDASTLTALRDDRGTDLAGEVEFPGPYEMSSRVSGDGMGLLTVVGTKGRPDPAARTLTAEGSLAILCASERATETSATAALAVGTTYTVGGHTFEVKGVGPSDWDPDKTELELQTKGSVDHVIAWALVGADGEVVELDESSTWTINDTITLGLLAPKALERAALRLEVWTDAETLQVPYSVTAGVGLR